MRQLRGRIDETQNQLQRQNDDLGKRIDDLAFQISPQAAGRPGTQPGPQPGGGAMIPPSVGPGPAPTQLVPPPARPPGRRDRGLRNWPCRRAMPR